MDTTEENWNRMARAYEEFTSGEDSYSYCIEWPCIQKLLPKLGGKSVIDLGCGTGRFTFWLEEMKPNRILGVDLSERMLDQAKAKAIEKHSKAEFQKEDVSEPFTTETFDVIFSSTMTHYVHNLNSFFQLVYQMLNDNGVCVLSVMNPVYTAQYPIKQENHFPEDEEWTIRYLDSSERGYIQPWIEYNDEIDNFLSSSYHYTFSEYVNAIIQSGLTIVEMQEPLPPKEWKEKCPQRYEGFIETPSYLVIKLQKVLG